MSLNKIRHYMIAAAGVAVVSLAILFAAWYYDCYKPRKALHRAAEFGDVATVTGLLLTGVDVEARSDRYWARTPLHTAALAGRAEIIEILIASGADVNARDSAGSTALHHAANGGHVRVIDLLVEAGADVRAKDNYDCEPLHRTQSIGGPGFNKAVLEALMRGGLPEQEVEEFLNWWIPPGKQRTFDPSRMAKDEGRSCDGPSMPQGGNQAREGH